MATRGDLEITTTATPLPCIQMFRDIAMGKAKDENFVFSPCSIHLALSLITNGATGSTLQVLLKFLEAENQEQLKSRALNLISALTKGNSYGPELSFVGGVWVDESMKLTQNFKSDAENIYKAKAEEVDFEKNAEEMLKTVNQWAAESSNGLIHSLLPQGSITEETQLLLANALYFKGKRSCPFEKELTWDSEFYLLDDGFVKVPFMSEYHSWAFIETFNDLKVARKHYLESSLSMYILLPNDRDGLWQLVEKIGSDPMLLGQYTSAGMKRLDPVPVGRFRVPKCEINYEFEAADVLKGLGLELCFSDDAKFDEVVIGGDIKVQEVYHGSHIKFDEDGTEAAASTVVDMYDLSYSDGGEEEEEPPIDFVADHPFMYVVKDDRSGMVLFMGHVVNPLLECNAND